MTLLKAVYELILAIGATLLTLTDGIALFFLDKKPLKDRLAGQMKLMPARLRGLAACCLIIMLVFSFAVSFISSFCISVCAVWWCVQCLRAADTLTPVNCLITCTVTSVITTLLFFALISTERTFKVLDRLKD